MKKSASVCLGAVAGIAVAVGGGLVLGESHAREVPAAATAKAPPPQPTSAHVDHAKALARAFAEVATQVGPSVVRITVTSTVDKSKKEALDAPNGDPFKRMPFERFFGDDDDDHEKGKPEIERRMGMGSGVVVDPRGYILTNNHVVENAETVKVTFVDGKEVTAKVAGTDAQSDVAVVKVDGVKVTPARLGNSDALEVGDWVIAIGNPFGLDHSVTVGVLSAKNRSGFESGHFEDFLQTDASINPGNSGGPLVDLDGEVVGINTMIAGIGTGIGFAVPMSMAKPIAEQLIAHGKVRRSWLGLAMQDETPELQKTMGKHAPDKGAIVSEVRPGSPAEKAGVKAGDIITAVDDQPVKGSREVQQDVLQKKVGDKVDLAVWHDGASGHVQAKTAEPPASKDDKEPEGAASSHEKLGLELAPLLPELQQELDLPEDTRGAVIAGIVPGGGAELAGLKVGDVIIGVDRKPIGSAQEAARALRAQRIGGHLVRVRRGQSALFVALPESQ